MFAIFIEMLNVKLMKEEMKNGILGRRLSPKGKSNEIQRLMSGRLRS
jgi:hypothetical protein